MSIFRSFGTSRPVLEVRRATALRHPCRLAAETAHPRFSFLIGAASVVLTVNAGYE